MTSTTAVSNKSLTPTPLRSRTTLQVSSSMNPATTPQSDEATIIAVIIVVAVVIILVFIILGFVFLVVLFKRRKQKLEINKLQNVKIEKEYIELKAVTIEKKASSEGYLNQNSNFTDEYNEINVIPADGKYIPTPSTPRLAKLSNPMFSEIESNPTYQNIDKTPSTTSVPQGTASADIYTMPDITSSQTVETDNETVYSEPIQPSLFTDVVGSPSDSEDLLPYSPIYTVPTPLQNSDKELLKVGVSNIREIRELGMGLFGKVILAKTVDLSPKDLTVSSTDHMGRRHSPRSVSMTSEQTVSVGGRIPGDSHPLIDLTVTILCTFDPPL